MSEVPLYRERRDGERKDGGGKMELNLSSVHRALHPYLTQSVLPKSSTTQIRQRILYFY